MSEHLGNGQIPVEGLGQLALLACPDGRPLPPSVLQAHQSFDRLDLPTLVQPKREMADFVEKQGFLVPTRFPGLLDARASGLPFYIRSESPDQLAGPSGLIPSHAITPYTRMKAQQLVERWGRRGIDNPALAYNQTLLEIDHLTQAELETRLKSFAADTISHYAQLLQADPHRVTQEISYSYWEQIPGVNWTVVADSAIPDRYHLFAFSRTPKEQPAIAPTDARGTRRPRRDGQRLNLRVSPRTFATNSAYLVVENGEVQFGDTEGALPPTDPVALVAWYEQIRRTVGQLGPALQHNCPLVEAVSTPAGNIYFLQYHLGSRFQRSTFTLDRPPTAAELPATFVHGATAPQGEDFGLTVHAEPGARLHHEAAGFDLHLSGHRADVTFAELMARRRRLQILRVENQAALTPSGHSAHLLRSQCFKPEISVGLTALQLQRLLQDSGSPPGDTTICVPIHVVSDGQSAYVTRK